jgi:hypothetical protein
LREDFEGKLDGKLEGAKGGSLGKIYTHTEGAAGIWSPEGVTDGKGLENRVLIGIDLERGRQLELILGRMLDRGNCWREWSEVSLKEDVR